MYIFDGERPHLVSSRARRAIDVDSPFKQTFPDYHNRLEILKNQNFKLIDGFFKSSRGLSLGTRTLIPPENILKKKSTGIVLCHGYTAHLRWGTFHVMMKLAEEGYLVTGLEYEGHGLSDTKAGLLTDLNLIRDDIHEFSIKQQKNYLLKNWFLFGESMGGMVSILESLKSQEIDSQAKFNGMILIAPMCKIADEVKPHPLLVSLLSTAAIIFPTLSVTPTSLNPDLIFKSKTFRDQVRLDPIKFKGKPRLATADALLRSTIWLESNYDKVTLPFFVLHGKGDVVTPAQGSKELYEQSTKIKEDDKEMILLDDAWHGLLYCEPEDDMKMYWQSIFNWIDKKSL